VELTRIQNKEDFILYYPWIKECYPVNLTPEQILANCLLGKYWGFTGSVDEKAVGIGIGETHGNTAFLVVVWAKNKLSTFLEPFLKLLKESGYKTIRASSKHPEEAYQRLTGMKKLWSVYEREL